MTDWPQLREIDWRLAAGAMAQAVLFDGSNLLEPKAIRKLGFDYASVGRA